MKWHLLQVATVESCLGTLEWDLDVSAASGLGIPEQDLGDLRLVISLDLCSAFDRQVGGACQIAPPSWEAGEGWGLVEGVRVGRMVRVVTQGEGSAFCREKNKQSALLATSNASKLSKLTE